jgi:hypothetical protein
MSHRSLFITVAVLLFSISARSQEITPPPRSDDDAAAVRKKAIDLLESVAGQADSLRSAENRARIRSTAAEMLWDHDEKRARNLFAAVEDDINSGFTDMEGDDSTRIRALMVFWQVRSDTINRIAKHDPDLALEFLRATRPVEDGQLPYRVLESEKSLELRLAGQIAAKNPQLALKLGRESLAKGFSGDLLSVLSQLRQKNKEASLTFYGEIVEKLKGADLAEDHDAAEFAGNLVRSFKPPRADEQLYRELLGVLLTSALANGCAKEQEDTYPHICYEIGSVYSQMEKYYGPRAAPLKRWADDAQDLGFSSPEEWGEVREVFEKGTVDEILALLPQYPGLQDQIYWGAMTKAKDSGDAARAQEIAAKVPDSGQRRYMLAQIESDQMWKLVNAEKLSAVQQQLGKLRGSAEQIQFLLYVATQIGANDRKAALGLLNQAGQIIDSTRPGGPQLAGQLGLAMLYCSLKSDRGFAIMESLIPRLNELVNAAATLDGIENHYLRDGEWNMSGDGGLGSLLNNLSQNAGYFANLDFDRSVTLASQFDRAELRLMAQLKLAQSILAPHPLSVTPNLNSR